MNIRNIRKIKQKLQILQNQNARKSNYGTDSLLNLTMIQVQQYCGVLCKLDAKLLTCNNTLVKIMEALNYQCYMTTLLTDMHTTVTRLTSAVLSLKEGVESFYEYIQVLADHELNPLIVSPLEL